MPFSRVEVALMKRLLLLVLAALVAMPSAAGAPPPGRWDPAMPGTTAGWTFTELFDNGVGYVSTGNGTFFKTSDGGQTWLPLPTPGLTTEARLTFGSPDVGFMGLFPDVYRTVDGGLTWGSLGSIPRDSESDQPFRIDALEAIPGTDEVVVSAWTFINPEGCRQERIHVLARTVDDEWLTTPLDFPASTYEVEFLDRNNGLVLVHKMEEVASADECNYAIATRSSQVLLTRDGGLTYKRIHEADFEDEGAVVAVAMPTPRRIVLGMRSGEILVSDNGGRWFRETARLDPPDGSVGGFIDAIDFGTPKIGYAGTNGIGMWRTDDGGRSWVLEASSVETTSVAEEAFRGSIAATGRYSALASGPGIILRRTQEP